MALWCRWWAVFVFCVACCEWSQSGVGDCVTSSTRCVCKLCHVWWYSGSLVFVPRSNGQRVIGLRILHFHCIQVQAVSSQGEVFGNYLPICVCFYAYACACVCMHAYVYVCVRVCVRMCIHVPESYVFGGVSLKVPHAFLC